MKSSQTGDLLEGIELLDEPGGDRLTVHFDGPFEGGQVLWHATLLTPAAWASLYGEKPPRGNIILVGEGIASAMELTLCLQVAKIDLPTIRKAITMVRQYKRLRRGRHEYGMSQNRDREPDHPR